jgi:septum formation inhibitor-activating ATPase MinD
VKQGRSILITGLPAGVGCSSFARALAFALSDMRRKVLLVASMQSLPVRVGNWMHKQRSGALLLSSDSGDPDCLPLESMVDPLVLAAFFQEYDHVVVDRFTGMNIRQNMWYQLADDVIVMADDREFRKTHSQILSGRIARVWPELRQHLVLSRSMPDGGAQLRAIQCAEQMQRYHQSDIEVLGWLEESPELARAGREARPFVRMYANHPSSRNLRRMARSLLSDECGFVTGRNQTLGLVTSTSAWIGDHERSEG